MCGLAAIYNLDEKDKVNDLLIEKMMNEIKERGPDHFDTYRNPKITLGHRRLSIIDLDEKANQPFYWKEKYVLIFNGAIYNYRELKTELKDLGYFFKTDSDTEVLIASYDKWGIDCLNKFNGMWAFILWDKKNETIFASRDRYGIKPLYFGQINNKIVFASEIKQLRAIGLGIKPNLEEISKFLYTGTINTNSYTCFKGIKSIPAGYNLYIKNRKKIILKKWYDLRKISINNNDKDHDLLELLNEAVNLRTRGDVKIGTLLSGGIDSSLITANLNQIAQSKKQNYSIFHGSSIDKETNETYYAKLLSDSLGHELIIREPSSKEFWESIEKICRLQDEPFGSTSIFMQYFVMEEVKNKGCKILLDGQGADELLLGYKRYIGAPFYKSIKEANIIQFIKSLINIFTRNKNLNTFIKLQYLFGPIFISIRTIRISLRLNFVKLPIFPSKRIYKSISKNLWDIEEMQIHEIYNSSLPSLLRFADRNSMHNSIELRLPYLDHRFVEKIIKTPLEFKIKNGWDKVLLRKSKLLPKEVAFRESKLGFASPEDTWIRKYSDKMLEHIKNSDFMSRVITKKRLYKKWDKLNNNEKWRIFNVSIWAEAMNIN